MRIGTDISIETCRGEGYMVMDYKVRDLFPHGKAKPLNKECLVQFTRSLPDYAREEMGWSVGDPMLYLNVDYSWDEIWEIYLQHKVGIDGFVGHEFDDTNPQPFDLLCLADAVDSWCGIGA